MSLTLPSPRTPDPVTAPPLRWGVLGTGWIAEKFIESLHSRTQQRLVAVGSRDLDRATAFAAKVGAERAMGSYEELVAADVDIVYIATPHSEHLSNALLAIQAGKAVLVEKAFARNAEEAQLILDAAAAARVPAMEAMWTRFLPHVDVVRQLLEIGALGELETVYADHGQWFPPEPHHRLFDPAKAGGAMLDLGVYPVSFAHFALGSPSRVTATGSKAFTGVDRQISAILSEYPDHEYAHALVTTTLAAKTPTVAFISGDKARVEIPGAFYAPEQVRFITRTDEVALSDKPTFHAHEGLAFEAAHFATMVAEGRAESELMPWSETMAVMETMDALRYQVGALLPGEDL